MGSFIIKFIEAVSRQPWLEHEPPERAMWIEN